jgi:8-oxo-dGTP pyrophosphatase MutT (NUDIX family)
MYISPAQLREFESRHGHPRELRASYEMRPREFDGLLKSQKHGRSHDITFFIRKEMGWVVIAKHWYPQGLYRIPSGGIRPDESMEEGTLREAREETGGIISLQEYFLRINVSFTSNGRSVDWTTHLVLADWQRGKLGPIDTREIRETRLAEREEFGDFGRIMLKSDSGGLHYREWLHRQAFKILDKRA